MCYNTKSTTKPQQHLLETRLDCVFRGSESREQGNLGKAPTGWKEYDDIPLGQVQLFGFWKLLTCGCIIYLTRQKN